MASCVAPVLYPNHPPDGKLARNLTEPFSPRARNPPQIRTRTPYRPSGTRRRSLSAPKLQLLQAFDERCRIVQSTAAEKQRLGRLETPERLTPPFSNPSPSCMRDHGAGA